MTGQQIALRIVAGIAGAVLLISTCTYEAHAWQQPYGGCDEAWQAPRSAGAAECREHRWRVSKRQVLNPHGVVRYSSLRACETGSAIEEARPCAWYGHGMDSGVNEGLRRDHWVDRQGRLHYVWAQRPHRDWRWVKQGLADALAESGAPRATTRDWTRCVVNDGPTTYVWCPDGVIETT